MTTGDQKLILRSNDPETIKRWLFTFQKSVALVLSAIIEGHEKPWADPNKQSESLGFGYHPSTVFTSHPSSNFEDLPSINSVNQYDQSGIARSRQTFNRSPSIPHPTLERRRTYDLEFRQSNLNQSTSGEGISMGFYRQVSVDNEAVMMRNQQQTLLGRPPISPSSMIMSSSYHVSSTGYLSASTNVQRPSQESENLGSSLARSPVIPINPFPDRNRTDSGNRMTENRVDFHRSRQINSTIPFDIEHDQRESISTIASDASSDKHHGDG